MKEKWKTQYRGELFCSKSDLRIVFRGKLDTLHSQFVLAQCMLSEQPQRLRSDLKELNEIVQNIICWEATGNGKTILTALGLDWEEIHRQSHESDRCFGVSVLNWPAPEYGIAYAVLNTLRTLTRECEVCGVQAAEQDTALPEEILWTLNRLSSALHVMMCRQQTGHYR